MSSENYRVNTAIPPTTKEDTMGQLRGKMKADLKIGSYRLGTQSSYLFYAQMFASYFRRSPAKMGADEVRKFLLYFVDDKECSRSTLK